ncbi:MAG TPA: hypothetical protein VIL32_12655, partial [Steroidobacteraceae bacterium]
TDSFPQQQEWFRSGRRVCLSCACGQNREKGRFRNARWLKSRSRLQRRAGTTRRLINARRATGALKAVCVPAKAAGFVSEGKQTHDY